MNLREWALPIYTIMMQLATGTLFVLWIIRSKHLKQLGSEVMDKILWKPTMIVFFSIMVAIIGSHFHLSNPILSSLALINFRSSWLSREIIFTVLMALVCAALVDQVWKPGGKRPWLKTILGWVGVLFGAVTIYCMSNIYLLQTQAPWNHWTTIILFFCSSILLGGTSATALLVMDAIFTEEHEPNLATDRLTILMKSVGWMAVLTGMAVLLTVLLSIVRYEVGSRSEFVQTSLALLTVLYGPLLILRFFVLFASMGIYIFVAYQFLKKRKQLSELVTPVYLACLLALISEILGRFLFYASHIRIGI